MKKAIVLISGGLDSTTAMGIALSEGREVYPVAFDYAQRHRRELDSAAKVVHHYAREGKATFSLRIVGLAGLDFDTSALTSNLEVPQNRDESTMNADIPVTYVPARNSIFLSIGTAFAEAIGADEVWAGFNALDYSGYPDCRPEYVEAMERSLALGTVRGVRGSPIALRAPIVNSTKREVIEKALEVGAPLHLTWSCYAGGKGGSCKACDSCIIRAKAFSDLGIDDPAEVLHG
jgi:7-cyano-7-deazaguanine synthase